MKRVTSQDSPTQPPNKTRNNCSHCPDTSQFWGPDHKHLHKGQERGMKMPGSCGSQHREPHGGAEPLFIGLPGRHQLPASEGRRGS